MKGVIAFLALCALAVSASAVPNVHRKKVVVDKNIILKQKNLIQLLVHVHQPNFNVEQKKIGDQWDIEANLDKYTNIEAVKNFVNLYKTKGAYPEHGFHFSVLRDYDLEMAIALFDALYFAKDFDTFYQTACWARDRINAGIFVYALHVAVLHRDDTQTVALPPIFEVLPNLFIDAQVIQRALEAKMRYNAADGQDTKTVIIPANYSRNYYIAKGDPETNIAPLTEDIGLNSYYAYFHLLYPFWMTQMYGKNVDRYGELFYYVHKQILARYNLQRIALGLPEIDMLSLTHPIKYGYHPELRYHNGMELPTRPDNYVISDNNNQDLIKVQDIERRLREVIDSGFIILKDGTKVTIYEKEGFEKFGKLVAGVWNSGNFKYYGQLYNKLRRLLSTVIDPQAKYGVAPGAAENYFTTLRDPAFYQVCARVDYLFNEFKSKIENYYTREQLTFPGVKIENVDVEKLITYFDEFDVDLINAIDVNSVDEVQRFKAIARTQRLNYKPFTYKVNVASDKNTNVMVRVFLGSKYDAAGNEVFINKMRESMVEIDRFPATIKTGKNSIVRNSVDSTVTHKDRPSMMHMLKKLENAIHNNEELMDEDFTQFCGLPQRLLLPKVTKPSMPFVLFVMVTPYDGPMDVPQNFASCGAGYNVRYPDSYPMGYPFDRVINYWNFQTPNMYFKDVLVFHKKNGDINVM